MNARLFSLFAGASAMAAAACAVPGEDPTGAAPSAGPAPTGAQSSDAGYWTIGEVPPSPFPETVPADDGGESIVDVYARENGISRAQAEREINGPPELHVEMDRIAERIRSENPDTFVDFRMVRDPAVAMEVWFTRDAAETLAQYTDLPFFRPVEGGLAQAAQERLRATWMARMAPRGPINGMSVDPFSGKVDLDVGISEDAFLALAQENGWPLDKVRANYAGAQPTAFVDPSLAAGVRVFAREATDPQIRLEALGIGRVVLEDGCFRLAADEGESNGKLVMFGYGAQLDRDEEGYLVVRRADAVYRIGEMGGWSGPNGVDEKNPDVVALREACGGGEIVNVAHPESYRLFGLPFPSWISDYAKRNGLTRQAAWDEVITCIAKQEAQGRIGLDARDRCIRQFN